MKEIRTRKFAWVALVLALAVVGSAAIPQPAFACWPGCCTPGSC